MTSRILYTKPSITDKEVHYATEADRNGCGDRCYEYIHRFEDLFKRHLGVKYAIATSSCTGALHMGLAALGVGSGDVSDERRGGAGPGNEQSQDERAVEGGVWGGHTAAGAPGGAGGRAGPGGSEPAVVRGKLDGGAHGQECAWPRC